MKLNLKVRFKNYTFWATFIPSLITFVYATLGCFEIVPPVSENMTLNLTATLLTFLANVGVLVDHTTKGIGDSERALTYKDPQ